MNKIAICPICNKERELKRTPAGASYREHDKQGRLVIPDRECQLKNKPQIAIAPKTIWLGGG